MHQNIQTHKDIQARMFECTLINSQQNTEQKYLQRYFNTCKHKDIKTQKKHSSIKKSNTHTY